jgi:serine/threonine-protein kinase PknG
MTTPAIRCTQPGCSGTIDGGYCDVCGVAAASAAPVSAPTAGLGRPAGTGAGVTTGSAAYGSASAVSGTGRGTSAGSTSTGSRRSRSASTRTTRPSRSSRGSLGAGLIEIPPVPARDPATAVLTNPQVPESKRYCGTCERPVGRSRDGRPGIAEGYCANCGSKFSFSPKLVAGELVAGQYEVLGCLAHGGLGWLYLAMDRNLSNRWVVLKGLLNATDPAAVEAAVAERRFLAEVEHPSIVGVYNFVQHADAATGEQAGYIVMEYIGGQSLRQLLLEKRRVAGESLPLPVALAYMIEVLPALGYLHARGLVYCDFKPDNVIQTEEQLKLIDMGGVHRIDDEDSAIYGTVGYQAPEIADDGPTPSSDLYTVGRALAVLSFEFSGYQTTYQHSLPDLSGVPAVASQESFLRALRRATDADPDRRFESAAEMAEQLTGVLREVLAVADQRPRPAFSTLFGPELRTIGVPTILAGDGLLAEAAQAGAPQVLLPPPGTAEIITGLPLPRVDRDDPAAGYLATLATLEPAQLTAVLTGAVAGEQGTPPAVAESPETLLALARARIVTGDLTGAATALAAVAARDPLDWRIPWHEGLAELAAGRTGGARQAFDAVYDQLPGDLAPKLALAFTAEAAGDQVLATRYFRLVLTVDRSYVSAAFGLARTLLHAGDRAGAISALSAVPENSSYHVAAQIAAVRIRVSPPAGAQFVSAADIAEAGRGLGRLALDPTAVQQVTTEVLSAALDRLRAREPLDGSQILGCDSTERSLRFGLERSYRAQAQLTSDRRRRTQLVDLANSIRPSTWA